MVLKIFLLFPSHDLNPVNIFLIQMLCEEGGLFLEIADVVRGFGLNILKGVMEVRHSKIWCHFIVEVCCTCQK